MCSHSLYVILKARKWQTTFWKFHDQGYFVHGNSRVLLLILVWIMHPATYYKGGFWLLKILKLVSSLLLFYHCWHEGCRLNQIWFVNALCKSVQKKVTDEPYSGICMFRPSENLHSSKYIVEYPYIGSLCRRVILIRAWDSNMISHVAYWGHLASNLGL